MSNKSQSFVQKLKGKVAAAIVWPWFSSAFLFFVFSFSARVLRLVSSIAYDRSSFILFSLLLLSTKCSPFSAVNIAPVPEKKNNVCMCVCVCPEDLNCSVHSVIQSMLAVHFWCVIYFLSFFSLLIGIHLAFCLTRRSKTFPSPLSSVNLPQLLFQLILNTRFSYSYCYPRENLFKTIIKRWRKRNAQGSMISGAFDYGSEELAVERMMSFSFGNSGSVSKVPTDRIRSQSLDSTKILQDIGRAARD